MDGSQGMEQLGSRIGLGFSDMPGVLARLQGSTEAGKPSAASSRTSLTVALQYVLYSYGTLQE